MKTLDELKAEYESAREARDAACDVYNDAYAAAGDAFAAYLAKLKEVKNEK